jgi:two-component system cell cycle response regulator
MRALLQESYTLIEAMDGREGIEQPRQHLPDLILSDLSMPLMDGFALLAAIRAEAALCDIPVVAVTASAMKGNREVILARGFDGYLSKPVDEELLRKTVCEVLHGN